MAVADKEEEEEGLGGVLGDPLHVQLPRARGGVHAVRFQVAHRGEGGNREDETGDHADLRQQPQDGLQVEDVREEDDYLEHHGGEGVREEGREE